MSSAKLIARVSSVTGSDGLGLDAAGGVERPVVRIDLDAWHDANPEAVARGAADADAALALTIGVATSTPPPHLAPLVEALSLTVVGPSVSTGSTSALIGVPEVEAAYADLAERIAARPQAAVALGQLVRQTARLGTTAGLAAEAAAYSMLLSGTEFADWLATTTRPAADADDSEAVRVERTGNTLAVTLDRPARRNALSFRLREDLFAALELAVLDDTIDRVVLTGAGPAFCSGGDLAEFGTASDYVAAYLVRLDRAPWRLLDRLRERIGDGLEVHVHGASVGAGLELAAFGGRVTCTPDARFLLPETAMGLVPGAGGTVSVVRRIGRWRTAYLVLGGVTIGADQALTWGLVDAVTEA